VPGNLSGDLAGAVLVQYVALQRAKTVDPSVKVNKIQPLQGGHNAMSQSYPHEGADVSSECS
jgi:hypothetical protein